MAEVRNFLQCLQNEGLDPGEIQTGMVDVFGPPLFFWGWILVDILKKSNLLVLCGVTMVFMIYDIIL
jgi:hypothetical protein